MNINGLEKELKIGHINVAIYMHKTVMGIAAGKAVANRLRDLLQQQKTVTMVFAAAPSQTISWRP
jgi:hypothetical protein